jgi:hypothetical protein
MAVAVANVEGTAVVAAQDPAKTHAIAWRILGDITVKFRVSARLPAERGPMLDALRVQSNI